MSRWKASDFGKVAVLFGGHSAEREVSLKSGRAVLAALQERGVDAHGVDPVDGLVNALQAGNFDRAFIVLHGRGGEDGTVQGLLEYLDIPYTGSGVLGSALAMDKLRSKQILHSAGIPTPEWAELAADNLDMAVELIGFPMFLKPAREGSSIGMSKVTSATELQAAYEAAAACDDSVIAEACLPGPEYTAAILGERVLPMIRLETPRDFYDYEAKYLTDDTQYHIPCGLTSREEKAFADICLEAFRLVGARGWGRVDFMLDANGDPQVLEVNTVPGMTDHSLVPMAAAASGLDFAALCWEILAQTLPSDDVEGVA
ncbi:MAG: D-alanine--D-alanine ligase [Gammaproteobacteria bacterium]|nr:D-alanine--D-alanine ligase [Gammaproteobacteria bacterium]